MGQKKIYLEDELRALNRDCIPHHIAMIMDGNRRWALEQGLPPVMGHWKGAETLSDIVRAASELGIKVVTVYAFSTENWGRDAQEIDALMTLFKHYLQFQKESMMQEGVRLETIGDESRLPADLQQIIIDTKAATAKGSVIDLVLALNYGGRDDIRRAIVSMIADCEVGKLKKEGVSESVIAGYLDTAKWSDPDILIRTSGEKRQSNFLLWQLSYSEFFHTEILWPDFNARALLQVVKEYQSRHRRLGKI